MSDSPELINASQLLVRDSVNLVEQLQKDILWEKGKNKQLLERLRQLMNKLDFTFNHCGICDLYYQLDIITCPNCGSFSGTLSFNNDELIQMINDNFKEKY